MAKISITCEQTIEFDGGVSTQGAPRFYVWVGNDTFGVTLEELGALGQAINSVIKPNPDYVGPHETDYDGYSDSAVEDDTTCEICGGDHTQEVDPPYFADEPAWPEPEGSFAEAATDDPWPFR